MCVRMADDPSVVRAGSVGYVVSLLPWEYSASAEAHGSTEAYGEAGGLLN